MFVCSLNTLCCGHYEKYKELKVKDSKETKEINSNIIKILIEE